MSSSFDTRYLVDPGQMRRLMDAHKGTLTENAQLNRAARLAAEEEILLKSDMPASLKTARLKPIGRELSQITKRVRLAGAPARAAAGGDEEEEDLVTGPLDTMLKSLLKPKPKTSRRTPTVKSAGTSTVKPPLPLRPRRPIEELPFAQTQGRAPWLSPLERADQVIAASRRRTRQIQAKRQTRQSEASRLKPLPGWEDFDAGRKLRRALHERDYT